MSILVSDGDILDTDCDAVVSPVDCTAAQGKALALAIAQKWPDQCNALRRRVRSGQLSMKPGCAYYSHSALTVAHLQAAVGAELGGEKLLIFATTKRHWSERSSLDYVRGCCDALVELAPSIGFRSIAIPALGCGEGGLDEAEVWPILEDCAARMLESSRSCERVVLYRSRKHR